MLATVGVGSVILGFLAFTWLLDIVDAFLNVSALTEAIPKEFQDVYPPEDYAKSQRYTKAKTWFSLANNAYSTVLFLAVWFLGGFNQLDLWVRSFNWHPILTGVLYIFAMALGSQFSGLPMSLYSDFVLEAKYGFNKKTLFVFVKDLFLSVGLTIVLGGPILAAILAFFQYAGSKAWIYCWTATSAFSLFVVFISPKYILPLFNKLEPLPNGELKVLIV
jgi:STE24 endopeptidase